MARGNSTWILVILVVLLVVFGVYTVWGKGSTEELGTPHEEIKADMDVVAQPDSVSHPMAHPMAHAAGPEDIEIIEAADEPAFQVGFGMGPGLYGSGRATSEMIGN